MKKAKKKKKKEERKKEKINSENQPNKKQNQIFDYNINFVIISKGVYKRY